MTRCKSQRILERAAAVCDRDLSSRRCRVRRRKSARGDKFRQSIELLEQCVVELTPALVGGQSLVTVSGHGQRVPANERGTRTLRLVKSQQKVGKADEGASALATAPNDGLRKAVICAMRERPFDSSGIRVALGSLMPWWARGRLFSARHGGSVMSS